MPDRPDIPAATRGIQPTHAQQDTRTDTVQPPGPPAGRDGVTSEQPSVRRVPTRLVGGMAAVLTAFAGGVVGTGAPGILLTGMVIVLAGTAVVAAVLVAGFTHAMVALTDEGRRRARSVEDVGALMTGAASAYGRILTQFGTLVRGRTMPPRSE